MAAQVRIRFTDEHPPTVPDHRRDGYRHRGRLPASAANNQQRHAADDARRAARVRDRARGRARGITIHLRRGGEARAGDDDRRRASAGRRQLAPDDGAARRAARRTAKGSARSGRRASDALGSAHHGYEHRASDRPVRAKSRRHDSSAVERRRHRVRARDDAVALDRKQSPELRTADEHLSQSDRAIRSEAAVGHHAHQGRSRSPPRSGPTPKSPPASIADRCTASRTA